MLNYSNVIENDKSYPGLQMREIKPVMKLIIRGKKRQFLSAVGKSLNLLLPNEANTSSRSDQLTALWLSPDEWMIFSNEILKSDHNNYDVEKLLNKNICKTNLGAVTDVTDQFVLINLKGDISPLRFINTNWSVTSVTAPKFVLQIFLLSNFSTS